MEGGVPRGEEPDSEPKNFHLSKQAGESHGNSESNSERAPLYSQYREAEIASTASGGAKNTAHKGFSNLYSNHELDRGQNTLIVCPNTHKTLIETSAASLGRAGVEKETNGRRNEQARLSGQVLIYIQIAHKYSSIINIAIHKLSSTAHT